MIRTGRPRLPGWKPFLRNHAAGIAAIDLFVVHTISFKLIYVLVSLCHIRRRLVSIAVTSNSTADLGRPYPSEQGCQRDHRARQTVAAES